MPDDIPDDIVTKLVKKFIEDIGEHVTSARVFVTYPVEQGDTCSYTSGHGDYSAQRGQIHEWQLKCDEQVRIRARKESEE